MNYVAKDCKVNTEVKKAINTVIEDKIEEICDTHMCIDQDGGEYIDMDVEDLRGYLQELVHQVEEAVHITMGISQD
jgi:hypothetical protein